MIQSTNAFEYILGDYLDIVNIIKRKCTIKARFSLLMTCKDLYESATASESSYLVTKGKPNLYILSYEYEFRMIRSIYTSYDVVASKVCKIYRTSKTRDEVRLRIKKFKKVELIWATDICAKLLLIDVVRDNLDLLPMIDFYFLNEKLLNFFEKLKGKWPVHMSEECQKQVGDTKHIGNVSVKDVRNSGKDSVFRLTKWEPCRSDELFRLYPDEIKTLSNTNSVAISKSIYRDLVANLTNLPRFDPGC